MWPLRHKWSIFCDFLQPQAQGLHEFISPIMQDILKGVIVLLQFKRPGTRKTITAGHQSMQFAVSKGLAMHVWKSICSKDDHPSSGSWLLAWIHWSSYASTLLKHEVLWDAVSSSQMLGHLSSLRCCFILSQNSFQLQHTDAQVQQFFLR